MVIERCFNLIPHFWPFNNHWTGQKSCFLIRRVLKKPFIYLTFPRGSCFAKIRVSCQTFKMVIERCFYLIPYFDHLKPLDMSEIMFSHQKSIIKGLFFNWHLPRGSCFAKIRVSFQTFKMVIERCFYNYSPILDHLKTTGQVRNHVFSSEECKKAFFLSDLPPGGLVLPK